jgi:hypothetical protein
MSANYAEVHNDPVPVIREKHDTNIAFAIHRNKNKNVVCYAANMENGAIKTSDPLKVDWIMFETAGTPREGLNMIERNSAYGVNVSPFDGKPGHFKVILASLPDKVLDFHMENGKPVAKTSINGVEGCTLNRVFVTSTTSWGMPKVQHIEMFGTDPSGVAVVEKKIP